jgi:hypothetical protein
MVRTSALHLDTRQRRFENYYRLHLLTSEASARIRVEKGQATYASQGLSGLANKY